MEKIAEMKEYRKNIRYDGMLPLAVGKSRTEKKWKNTRLLWSQVLKKLEEPIKTPETYAEYMKISKSRQDQIKDVGGFIGGSLKDGRRKAENVRIRQIITLDADFAPVYMLEDMDLLTDYNYAVYSTHKHCPEKPRLRILIPLKRQVTPDEYEAVGRKLAEEIGIDYFDDTTYQASRLMYWPSISIDGEYIFQYHDNPWLDPDEVLARYPDWTDTSCWPESSRTAEKRRRTAKKQGDPCAKRGPIGAFCRTYSIGEAIDTFLTDVYEPCAVPGRYTYKEGSTAAGLVLYDDKFAYSNHATDPAGGKLCNAFDIVRIHKFGMMDEDTGAETSVTKLPSYKEMMQFVQEDENTGLTLIRERQEQAEEDFPDDLESDGWKGKLERNKKGIANTLHNVRTIMQKDPKLKEIRFNQMADNLEICGEIPWNHPGGFWRDADDAQLENYLDVHYAEFSKAKILSAVTKVTDDRSYHPVREYLDSLESWDGVKRVDTLLIDYLGAEDSAYTRAVTRKTLCAAIARVKNPGCKFDYVLTLIGPQGIGKSTLIGKLGQKWYSDSLNLTDIRDKTAAEKLQGIWLMEIGELAGMGTAGTNTLKGFLSRQDDQYRASYGRRVSPHPRQCIMIGTTNEAEFVRDSTGGRRFWPVICPARKKKAWDITQDEVDQIWAETLYYYNAGEKLILPDELYDEAVEKQADAMEKDPRIGMVEKFLNTPLPLDWYDRKVDSRRDYFFYEGDPLPQEQTMLRGRVCYQEIWVECYGKLYRDMTVRDRKDIKTVLDNIPGWKQSDKKQQVKGYSDSIRVYERRQN